MNLKLLEELDLSNNPMIEKLPKPFDYLKQLRRLRLPNCGLGPGAIDEW